MTENDKKESNVESPPLPTEQKKEWKRGKGIIRGQITTTDKLEIDPGSTQTPRTRS
jgi:hypothetical protein